MRIAEQVSVECAPSLVVAVLTTPRPGWLRPFLALAAGDGAEALRQRTGTSRDSAAEHHHMRLTLRRPSAASPAVSRIAFDWRVSGTPTVFARAFGDLVVRPAQLVATLAIEGECEGLVAPESVTRRPCERAARSLIGSLRDAIESADMT